MAITAKKISPYVKGLLLVALLAAAGYVYYFWQYDLSPALTGSQTVFALQRNMAVQTVDINKFNNLVKTISQKTSSSSAASLVTDPFQ